MWHRRTLPRLGAAAAAPRRCPKAGTGGRGGSGPGAAMATGRLPPPACTAARPARSRRGHRTRRDPTRTTSPSVPCGRRAPALRTGLPRCTPGLVVHAAHWRTAPARPSDPLALAAAPQQRSSQSRPARAESFRKAGAAIRGRAAPRSPCPPPQPLPAPPAGPARRGLTSQRTGDSGAGPRGLPPGLRAAPLTCTATASPARWHARSMASDRRPGGLQEGAVRGNSQRRPPPPPPGASKAQRACARPPALPLRRVTGGASNQRTGSGAYANITSQRVSLTGGGPGGTCARTGPGAAPLGPCRAPWEAVASGYHRR